MNDFDIIILGSGIVGSAFALSLINTDNRFNIAIIDIVIDVAVSNDYDSKIFTITNNNYRLLEKNAVNVNSNRIGTIEQIKVYGRGSVVEFDALDVKELYLAKVIENSLLINSIHNVIKTKINFINDKIINIEFYSDKVILIGIKNNYTCKLLVSSDGINSLSRKLANISTSVLEYKEQAIVANFECELNHNSIAHQWFATQGILAFLPFVGNIISTVLSTQDFKNILTFSDNDYINLISTISNNQLGSMKLINRRQTFSLKMNLVDKFYANNVILIGDSAHSIHPLAGQGVNLGLQDAFCLANIISKRKKYQLQDTSIFIEYNRLRKMHVRKMQLMCHGLNRLFTIDSNIFNKFINYGFKVINSSNSIKSFFINQANF